MFSTQNLRTVILMMTLALLCTVAGAQEPEAADSTNPSEAPRIEILNAKTPQPGVLTGGQPTPEQFEEAAQAGYRTVVNLRTEGEKGSWDEAAKAAELGLRYVAIPVAGAEGISAENAEALAEVLKDPENLPAMVHCGSGNRVGAVFALMAFHVEDEDAQSALERGLEAGLTSLEPLVRQKLDLPTEE